MIFNLTCNVYLIAVKYGLICVAHCAMALLPSLGTFVPEGQHREAVVLVAALVAGLLASFLEIERNTVVWLTFSYSYKSNKFLDFYYLIHTFNLRIKDLI
jgi:hypothetical protein